MNKITEIKISYNTKSKVRPKIKSSESAYEILLNFWDKSTLELHEEFKVIYLNNSNEVLGIYPLSKGGITGTVVDIRLIFSVALKCNAVGIILAHNHPSGTLKASESDKVITRKIKNASEFMDIKLLDHLIITKESFLSFTDEGIL